MKKHLKTYEDFSNFLHGGMSKSGTLYSFAPWHYLSIIYVKAIYRLYQNNYNTENMEDFKKLFYFQNFIIEYNNLKKEDEVLIQSIKENLRVCGIEDFQNYESISEKTKEIWSVMAIQFDYLFYN